MVKINSSLSKEKRILKAAEKVFFHKGYSQATLDEIIKIADTGKGTVYKYYKNKENLFYTLVEAKNRKLIKDLNQAVGEHRDFAEQFQSYVFTFLKFLYKNETLWSVILFELLTEQAGWRLKWDEKKQNWNLEVRWGKPPEENEIAVKRRYAELIRSEVVILRDIFQRAMDDAYIKPIEDLPLMAQNFYFSIFMLSNQGALNVNNMEESVKGMIDRFLYGHIKRTAAQ